MWWADLPTPRRRETGFRRPVLVVQGDALNASRIATVLCVPLSSNLGLAAGMGNVVLDTDVSGLPKDSVANVSQVFPVERELFAERVGTLSVSALRTVLSGIDIALGR